MDSTRGSVLRLQAKVDAAKVKLSKDAALVINGANVHIRSLDLDGALTIDAAPGAKLVIDGLKVQNKGWMYHALNPNKASTEEQKIRCVRSPPLLPLWRELFGLCCASVHALNCICIRPASK